jgi:hypothetical protein
MATFLKHFATRPLFVLSSVNQAIYQTSTTTALSNAVTKILESLLLSFIESQEAADEYQFDFKKNYSTSICTKIFKQTVSHYRQNGSHVLPALLIITIKAFDNVDFWLLFCKLIDNNNNSACCVATRSSTSLLV